MDEFFQWLHKASIVIAIQSAITGVIMVVLAGVGAEPPLRWKDWARILSVSTLVSVLVGWAIHDWISSEVLRCAIVGLCSVVSREILAATRLLGGKFAKDPVGTIHDIRHNVSKDE